MARGQRAQLGHGDLPVRQQLQQERLEGLVGTVDLVDQQHAGLVAAQRGQQRSFQQVVGGEQVGLGPGAAAGLGQADGQQLAAVVPFIRRLRQVEAFVALQAHQTPAGGAGLGQRQRGLADAGVAFQQQRAL